MEDTIFTIGYSGFSADEFMKELKKNDISVLIDVRSSPFSAYYTDFNKPALENRLRQNSIYYSNFAPAFGARQEDRRFYSREGYLDFEKFAASEQFKNGVDKLCCGMEKGYRTVLMCAEKNPAECHRCILVSRAFSDRGHRVVHLLPNGISQTQEDVEAQLLNDYFPDREQFSLFETPDETELINEAYRRRNAEIGYRLEENVG